MAIEFLGKPDVAVSSDSTNTVPGFSAVSEGGGGEVPLGVRDVCEQTDWGVSLYHRRVHLGWSGLAHADGRLSAAATVYALGYFKMRSGLKIPGVPSFGQWADIELKLGSELAVGNDSALPGGGSAVLLDEQVTDGASLSGSIGGTHGIPILPIATSFSLPVRRGTAWAFDVELDIRIIVAHPGAFAEVDLTPNGVGVTSAHIHIAEPTFPFPIPIPFP